MKLECLEKTVYYRNKPIMHWYRESCLHCWRE